MARSTEISPKPPSQSTRVKLTRRAFGTSLASGLALSALPAQAQQVSIAEVSRYLNGLRSSRGSFTQINDDGSISTGTVSIKRPGRMRFDYNPPEQALVLASGGAVAIFDRKTRARPESYPLGNTPLKFILQRNVDLAASGVVARQTFDGTATTITAQDPQNPEIGSIDLVFTNSPVQLRQWVMRTDGGETTVILGEMDPQVTLPNSLFNIQAEIAKLEN